MCYITAHDKQQPTYIGDTISGGGRSIPKNSATAALESLGVTLNFIGCWLKPFHHNDQVRCKVYNEPMKKFFKQILTSKSKPLSQD